MPNNGEEPPKSALLITGREHRLGGSSTYLNYVCSTLCDQGMDIHTAHFSSLPGSKSEYWNTYCNIKVDLARIENLALSEQREHRSTIRKALDALTSKYSVDLVLANYIHVSEALAVLPNTLPKVLVTHDAFTNRRHSVKDHSSTNIDFDELSRKEEQALACSDLVIAITESDHAYFAEEYRLQNVVTLPYMVDPRRPFDEERVLSPKRLRIGYLGSGYRNNIDTLTSFFDEFIPVPGFEMVVGGGICSRLDSDGLPRNVRLVGEIADLDDFYTQCDLIVNPDELYSGQKIKSVEALAHGCPLVCTRAASQGLDPVSVFHTANTSKDCYTILCDALARAGSLVELVEDSRTMYRDFYHKKSRFESELISALSCL